MAPNGPARPSGPAKPGIIPGRNGNRWGRGRRNDGAGDGADDDGEDDDGEGVAAVAAPGVAGCAGEPVVANATPAPVSRPTAITPARTANRRDPSQALRSLWLPGSAPPTGSVWLTGCAGLTGCVWSCSCSSADMGAAPSARRQGALTGSLPSQPEDNLKGSADFTTG